MDILKWLLSNEYCLLCSGINKSRKKPVCAVCRGDMEILSGNLCLKCGKPLISEETLCLKCRTRTFAFSNHRSLFLYSGKIKELVRQYKFENKMNLAWFFAEYTAEVIGSRTAVIIPVPSRKANVRQRGYDAAGLISTVLRKKYGCNVCFALKRSRSRSQKKLNYEERQTNLIGKIRIKKNFFKIIAGRDVILLDDVFTTGATMDYCASAVLSAGAKTVSCLTMAMD